MEPEVILKALAGGGLAGVLILLIYVIGMRVVAALDRVVAKLDQHTKEDLASHSELRGEMIGLHAKIDGMLDAADRLTPVGVEIPESRARTPHRGIAIGGYGPMRPGTKGDR